MTFRASFPVSSFTKHAYSIRQLTSGQSARLVDDGGCCEGCEGLCTALGGRCRTRSPHLSLYSSSSSSSLPAGHLVRPLRCVRTRQSPCTFVCVAVRALSSGSAALNAHFDGSQKHPHNRPPIPGDLCGSFDRCASQVHCAAPSASRRPAATPPYNTRQFCILLSFHQHLAGLPPNAPVVRSSQESNSVVSHALRVVQ